MGFNNPGAVVPSLLYTDYTDWVGTTAAGETGWTDVGSGTGAAQAITSADEAKRPGQLQLSTGTTTTGRSGVHKGGGSGFTLFIRPQKKVVFEASLKIPVASDGTNGFVVRVGLGTTTLANNNRPVNGVFFEYDPVNSPANQNWKLIEAFSPVTGVTDSLVAVVAGAWTKLRIEIGSDYKPDFYIDGVLVRDSASAVTTTQVAPFLAIYKNGVGTTSRDLIVDYALYEIEFETAR